MVAVRVDEDDVPDPFFAALMAGVECLEVADLLHPPAFYADALCREHPETNFFPERGEPNEPAKEVCRRCLCRAECLTFALEHHEKGVWGATSEKQRKQLLNGRLTVADVFAALDARTQRASVVDAHTEMSPMGDIPEPGVEVFPCHSCEQLFAIYDLVLGHWCEECW